MIRRQHLRGSTSAVRLGFGSIVLIMTVALSLAAKAQTFTVLYSFKGPPDGGLPLSGVIRDSAGHLYGTNYYGGAYGYGTVFEIDTHGKETVLYSFAGGSDGANPVGGLARDAAGNLYGATDEGGNPDCGYGYTCGTVYKVDTSGRETVLYRFGGLPDGHSADSSLIVDKAGNLYGTTEAGGDNGCNPGYGCGIVFKIDKHGRETILHTFTGTRELDGAFPYAGFVADARGYLYSTTTLGGAPACLAQDHPETTGGCGTVFRIDKLGKEMVLHRFSASIGGLSPSFPVILDRHDNIYGTAQYGGSGYNGVVFTLNRRGQEKVLYNFSYDEGFPCAGLVRDERENFYSTTCEGGYSYEGTVYKLDKAGNKTVLHTFSGYSDGGFPAGTLVMDERGNLYGAARDGGVDGCGQYNGCGVVFKITP